MQLITEFLKINSQLQVAYNGIEEHTEGSLSILHVKYLRCKTQIIL